METDGKFYLGRIFDPNSAETTQDPLLYDPDDLTTHAVVVGMTGSGKTGLCLDLLEEAGLNNVPALMIDPKGDITNALLHFPDLLPADFEPWVNATEARREGKTTAEVAAATAELWRNGLASWDITPARIQRLQDGPRFAVYTPGSDAGLPVSILASLKAPALDWNDNREALREQISGTVTALLGLIGMKDIDPVRSREHILLANIFETAWSQGQDLNLGELIMQTQSPPFEKLGVFDIERFFPEKDRFELAMLLNNILAAPAFQAWIEGEPLDIQGLLYEPDGRARHTIFYIAHLSDSERMFFVTLLYSAVESWMRTQAGTPSLRALVYFDEIFGYLPPIGNPPSKEPMLRLLKQARAFGVGLVLATQNPVDIDYKALSNAGTWFIGKLGTEQDKARLLDGLATAAGAGLDRREYDDLISALGKRVFLLRNVHEKAPLLFQTRWAMNYLAGPVTRNQIPALNALAGHGQTAAAAPVTPAQRTPPRAQPVPAAAAAGAATGAMAERVAAPSAADPLAELGSQTAPAVPKGINEYYLPNNLTAAESARKEQRRFHKGARPVGLLYRPVLLAQANIHFSNRKYNYNEMLQRAALLPEVDDRGATRWEDFLTDPIDPRQFDRAPLGETRFASLPGNLTDNKLLRTLQDDFQDWLYRYTQVDIRANEDLDVYAPPGTDDAAFRKLCEDAAEDKESAEREKVKASFEKKLDSIKDKLAREERELAEDEAELAARKREETVKHAETIFGLFTKRRSSFSGSMTKRRMTSKAKEDVEESVAAIAAFKEDIADLEEAYADEIQAVEDKWDEIIAKETTIPLNPFKKDIDVNVFGLAWLPYHIIQDQDGLHELPGYAPE
ncbi:MAG: DUF87 domain-containing protein [Ardenticatenales bacterium]|nr:DUF87 domain-containing protein [Ardenticatenales bacterium]